MSTSYIYNGQGQYETRDGELGICLTYARTEFWLPFEKVTPIPDWTFNEVDHDRSTANTGERVPLTYHSILVRGNRVAEELLNKQIPTPYSAMGIIIIEGKLTGNTITVKCGVTPTENHDPRGNPFTEIMTVDIPEREATKSERERAARLAEEYEKSVVSDYFNAKRERMTGGKGRNRPDPRTRLYMDKWNLEDIDDVMAHSKATSGMDPEVIKAIILAVSEGSAVNKQKLDEAIASVRMAGKAQVSSDSPNGRRSLGLAEKKARNLAAEELAEKE